MKNTSEKKLQLAPVSISLLMYWFAELDSQSLTGLPPNQHAESTEKPQMTVWLVPAVQDTPQKLGRCPTLADSLVESWNEVLSLHQHLK